MTRFFKMCWIGCCALAMVAATRLRAGLPVGAPCFLEGLIFCSTVFGYHFAHPDRRVRFVAWAMGGIAFLCFWEISFTARLLLVIPAVILGFYYGWKWPQNVGLRWKPDWKPPAVAIAWAWVTVLLPVEGVMNTGLWLIFCTRVLFISALALAYDLHDSAYDLKRGLETVANRIGAAQTLRLIDWLLAAAGTLELLRVVAQPEALWAAIALWINFLSSRWVIRRLFVGTELVEWRKTIIDALMVWQLVLLWAAWEW
ncbi:MAG: hypothetical protein WCR52_12795 [Bacteroidota bacterium]